MRLCPSNGITGIRLREGSAGVAGGRAGLGAEANNGSPRARQLGRAQPSHAEGVRAAGSCRPLPPSLPPARARSRGWRSFPGRGCRQTPKRGVVSSIDLCK